MPSQPPAGASNGERIRWAFERLNERDLMHFARQIGMRPPQNSRADRGVKAAYNARTRLASRLRRI